MGPLWQEPWLTTAFALGVVFAGAAEVRAARDNRRLIAPALVGAALVLGAFGSGLLGREIGPMAALLGYDALMVAGLAAVGGSARAPSRSRLTDLAVELGPTPIRDVHALSELVRAEPGLELEAEMRAALAAAQRLEAANERARAELHAALADVARSRQRLLVSAAAERARLAHELDETVAEPLRELTAAVPATSAVRQRLLGAQASLDAALSGLRPPGLEDGLEPALRRHPLAAQLGVSVDASADRCDQVVEYTLYAVASEALTNAAKHAGAEQVSIRYRTVDGTAELTVTDNGRGGATGDPGGGLIGLADAIEALGGSLSVVSPADTGTTVTAAVPLAPTAAWPRPHGVADKPPASGSGVLPPTP